LQTGKVFELSLKKAKKNTRNPRENRVSCCNEERYFIQ